MEGEGWAIWITGLPASGKSTLARMVKRRLEELGINAQILESDVIRKVLTPNPTYSPEEREIFYNSLVYIGVLLTRNGVNVIFDATAHRMRWRRAARGLIEKFLQVYIRCPLEVCRERDKKGVYRKAEAGEARYVPGIQEEYEESWDVDLVIDCVTESPETAAEKVIMVMKENGFI